MKNNVPTILCLLTMLGFALMFVQTQWKPFKLEPLKGFTPVVEKPKLTFDNYVSDVYQKDVENYVRDNFGFREFLIRAYNQFTYSCFGKSNNENIKVGRNRELYLKMYLEEIVGNTLRARYSTVEETKAAAEQNVETTLRLVDTMQSHGTQFLFVFAPSKTWIYPENMPWDYRNHVSDFSLEEYYIGLFKEKGIPCIDFLNYFKSWKNTSDYPLYTRTGTHWAASTLPFVTDSIMKKIGELTGKDLPGVRCVDVPITTDYTEQDAELEENMNLLFPMRKPALPRPIAALDDTMGKASVNLLVVGDSYFGTLLKTCFTDAFARWDYWEYNKTVISSNPDYNFAKVVDLVDSYKVLEEADVVMAVFTAPMLYDYMFGFAETAFDLYEFARCDSCVKERKIQWMMTVIQSSPEWYDAVVKQAEEKGIPIEEALRGNAEYTVYKKSQNAHEE